MFEEKIMNQFKTSRKLMVHLSKGLLILPFLFNTSAAVELYSKDDTSTSASKELASSESRSDTTTASTCPTGFYHSGIQNVCVEEDLSSNVVISLSSSNECQRGFEKIIGTNFCLQNYHFLSANSEFYLVEGSFNDFCPEYYSKPPATKICVQKRLSLIELDGELKLTSPNDGTGVPPDEATGLFAAPPIECEPGFIKPPGFHFCIANTLATNAEPNQHEFVIPVGECPLNWSREIEGGFCLPENYLHICGTDFPCKEEAGDTFRILKEPLSCPEGFIYQQANIPTYNTSRTQDFAVIPVYACVPPDKFNQ